MLTSNWGKGDLAGKLYGTYELNVAERLVGIINSSNISTFSDLGCADGFHATGIGRIEEIHNVLCFDIDQKFEKL